MPANINHLRFIALKNWTLDLMEKAYIGNVCCLIPLYVFAYMLLTNSRLDCCSTSDVLSGDHPSSRVSNPCSAHSHSHAGKGGGGVPQLCVAASLISSKCSRSGKVKSLLLGSVSSRTADFLSLMFTNQSLHEGVQKSTASGLHWEAPCFPAFVTALCQEFITNWPFPFFGLQTSFFLEQSTRWLWLSSTSLLTKAPYVRPKVGWIYVR